MSIYGSSPFIGEAHDDPDAPPGVVLAYQASHVYPDVDTHDRALVDTAHIPGHCVPGQPDDADWPTVGPWLRLGFVIGDDCPAVVLDEGAVDSLHEQLWEWLAATRVHPRTVGGET